MSYFVISQILVAIAIVFDLMSFQFKERRKIVFCLFIAGILITGHFVLLEQWTASGLMALATTRYLTSVFTTSKKMMVFFSVSSVVVTSLTYVGLTSIISCIGSLFQTTAAFCKDDQKLRLSMIVGTSFWLLHNYLVGSPVAVLMEVLFITSNIVGYYRYYIKPLKVKVKVKTTT